MHGSCSTAFETGVRLRKGAGATASPVLVNLALQGGGSHGAFTWGVLDRLLDERGLWLDGISGTSAGAMNVAVMLSGLEWGGRKEVRAGSDAPAPLVRERGSTPRISIRRRCRTVRVSRTRQTARSQVHSLCWHL